MHREKLVVGVDAEEILHRSGELNTHAQRQNPRCKEEAESGDDVPEADVVVINRGKACPPFGGAPDAVQFLDFAIGTLLGGEALVERMIESRLGSHFCCSSQIAIASSSSALSMS